MQLFYNVLLASAIWQHELAIYRPITPPFSISISPQPHPTHLGHHRTLSWAPCSYSRFPLAICFIHGSVYASPVAQRLKRLPAMQEIWVRSLGWEDLLEKEMATHSSILAWRIPWTEEPGGLQSTGSQRVGHDWVTSVTHSVYICQLQSPNSSHSPYPRHAHTSVLHICVSIPALQIDSAVPFF